MSRIYDPQNFDFNGEGSWLVMAQANYMLDGIAAEMKSTGQFFERYNQPSLGQRVRDAISAWIKLSTIHGSKGGEADNVLLYLDLSSKALQEMERNPDDAHRVLYVGITRTKNNLVLKMPEDQQRGWAV